MLIWRMDIVIILLVDYIANWPWSDPCSGSSVHTSLMGLHTSVGVRIIHVFGQLIRVECSSTWEEQVWTGFKVSHRSWSYNLSRKIQLDFVFINNGGHLVRVLSGRGSRSASLSWRRFGAGASGPKSFPESRAGGFCPCCISAQKWFVLWKCLLDLLVLDNTLIKSSFMQQC